MFSLRACRREVAAISVPAQRGEKPSVPWVSEAERMEDDAGAAAATAFKLAKCLLHSVLRASPWLLTLTTNAYSVCMCVCKQVV